MLGRPRNVTGEPQSGRRGETESKHVIPVLVLWHLCSPQRATKRTTNLRGKAVS